MQRLNWIFTAPATLMLLAGTTLLAVPPPSTVTALSFSPSANVPQFSTASAVITVTSGGLPVTSGTVELFQAKGGGQPSSCTAQNGQAQVQPSVFSGTPNALGQVTVPLDTTVLGTLGYIAHFSQPGQYSASDSGCLDLTVSVGDGGPQLCPAGQNATISATFVTSPGFPLAGSSNTWHLLISVHACRDLTNVSAQGGKNAWTGAAYGSPSQGSVTLRKATGGNNEVSVWTIGSMATGATETLPVTVTGNIKPNTACGTVLGLLGSWSALSTSADFGSQKSLYSGTSTVTVGPVSCP